MNTHVTRVALAIGIIGSGCVRRYSQPGVEEPHAEVQVRVVHHTTLGPNVDEAVSINGEEVNLQGYGAVRQATLRVRPELMQYGFETQFYHLESHVEMQTTYQTQRYQCGYNRVGPVYCNRQVPVTRPVTVTNRISDGGCNTLLDQNPLAGAVYLVQYEFAGVGQCRATCQRLVQGPNGQTLATQCGVGEPAPPTAFPPSQGFVTATATSSGGEVLPTQ